MGAENLNRNDQEIFNFFTAEGDVAIRYGYWPCRQENKNGTVVLLNGRREFMEKYVETIAMLNERVYDVFSLDWRGQGGSGRLLQNRHKGIIESYDSYLSDLNFFIQDVVRPRAILPLIVIAHSMGGHIVLRYLQQNPQLFDRAVLVSPLIDITASRVSRKLFHLMARLMIKMGRARSYIIGSGDHTAAEGQFKANNRRTSDRRRFMIETRILSETPELALGGVTYGWLGATLESIDILMKPGFAEKIYTPILMISAGADRVVSNKAQQSICSVMPACRLRIFPDARHEVLNETDAVLQRFWQAFDEFVRVEPQ